MSVTKILIVDDTILLLEELTEILEMEGFVIKACSSVLEAQKFLENEIPNLLITDLIMPGMDGIDLINFVRRKIQHPLPIIICTASNYKERSKEILKLNIQSMISKPFDIEVLLNEINRNI